MMKEYIEKEIEIEMLKRFGLLLKNENFLERKRFPEKKSRSGDHTPLQKKV